MYTLKLDLSQYEHDVLVTLLSTELQRGERDGTTDSPWHGAIAKIADDITGYDSAVAVAKAIKS